jgi:hypothetical protein
MGGWLGGDFFGKGRLGPKRKFLKPKSREAGLETRLAAFE